MTVRKPILMYSTVARLFSFSILRVAVALRHIYRWYYRVYVYLIFCALSLTMASFDTVQSYFCSSSFPSAWLCNSFPTIRSHVCVSIPLCAPCTHGCFGCFVYKKDTWDSNMAVSHSSKIHTGLVMANLSDQSAPTRTQTYLWIVKCHPAINPECWGLSLEKNSCNNIFCLKRKTQ